MTVRTIYLLLLINLLLVYSCTSNNDEFKIVSNEYSLCIDKNNFAFSFVKENTNIIVPSSSTSSVFLNGDPVNSFDCIESNEFERLYRISNSKNDSALLGVSFLDGIAEFKIIPLSNDSMEMSLRFGQMHVAHGLGDAGAYHGNFNLIGDTLKTYKIQNNGGTQRWASTFVIFPQNEFAAVFFKEGERSVTLSKSYFQMNVKTSGETSFFCFTGRPRRIYENYKYIRENNGYKDVFPKRRLFELGWESWGSLGWNTNQRAVIETLDTFISNAFPIKWAVTGSGFFPEGETTTSFGKWSDKFPSPAKMKQSMKDMDISWMIGLRTNFVPPGGPFTPSTKHRNWNLKVQQFNGNPYSEEAIERGYFLKDCNGSYIRKTSGNFPLVPCYMLDGNNQDACEWFYNHYLSWNVDGIKEDAMINMGSQTGIFNDPIKKIADEGGLVMARCGEFSSPGTLLRINDTKIYRDIEGRLPINYLQYAASGCPNVYSDVAGIFEINDTSSFKPGIIRHAWLLATTAGMAMGAYPYAWSEEELRLLKKTVDFHYSLVPYLHSAAISTYREGYPYTLTPLSIAYPNDSMTQQLSNFQWLVGESLLAAPLLKGYKTRHTLDIYLPEGIWYDFEDDTQYIGPCLLKDYSMSIDKVPCFVGGKGLLLWRDRQTDELHVKVYPVAKDVSVTFFSDNGTESSIISIKDPDWSKIKIRNLSSGKLIKSESEGVSYSFKLKMGNNYSIY